MEKTKDNDEAIAAIFGNVRALAGVLGTAGAQAQAMALAAQMPGSTAKTTPRIMPAAAATATVATRVPESA